MKHTIMSVAHELAKEYNLNCVICGDCYQEIHHMPKRRKNGAAPEILGVSLWPICKKCHIGDPSLDEIKRNLSRDDFMRKILHMASVDHVERCFARGCYNVK